MQMGKVLGVVVLAMGLAYVGGAPSAGWAWGMLLLAVLGAGMCVYRRWVAGVWLCGFVAVYAWGGVQQAQQWHQLALLNQQARCEAVVQVVDFARASVPVGQRVAGVVVEAKSCPLVDGARLLLRDYEGLSWELGGVYAVGLHLAARAQELRKGKAAISATVVDAPRLVSMEGGGLALRAGLAQRIEARYALQTRRWWQALLIGGRQDLSTQDWAVLRRSATAHLLAISGLHLALVAGAVFWLVQGVAAYCGGIATRVAPRSLALVAALVVGLVYVGVSGAQAPVVRAWWMFALWAGHWFYAPLRGGLLALMLTAVGLLLYDGAILFSASAWLSFYATAVVIVLYRRYYRRRPLAIWWRLQLGLTLALLPLGWAIFGGVSVVGFGVNLLLVPWLGVVLFMGYLGLVWAWVAPWADAMMGLFLQTMSFFAQWEWSYIVPRWQPNVALAGVWCAGVLLALLGQWRWVWGALGLALMLAVGQLWPRMDYVVLRERPLLAVIAQGRQAFVVNAGYRHRKGIDEVETLVLPLVRQRGLSVAAVLLLEDSKRATTGLITLKAYAPEMAVYTLRPLLSLPFDSVYCPQEAVSGVVFYRKRQCEALVGGRFVVNAQGVQEVFRQ